MQNCQVCKDEKSLPKYKCPSCFIRYCSLDCFKLHKNDQDSKIYCEKVKDKLPKERKEDQFQQNKQFLLDENDVIVPEQKLKVLGQSETLRPYLQHSKLKEVIKHIDGAKHRTKELQKRLRNDEDFKKFVDLMLKELGYLNEQGQFEVEYQ